MSFRFLLVTVAPPVAGVAVGYLAGGRLAGLRSIRIRALWLVWLAAGVQFAQYSLGGLRHFVEDTLGVPMLVLIFSIVLVWLTVNLVRWPAAIRVAGVAIVLGAALNGLVIAFNGRMPYDPGGAAGGGPRAAVVTPKNEPADGHTRLGLLGDVVPISPLRTVVSAGDILIGGGACLLVVLAMRRHRRAEPLTTPGDDHECDVDPARRSRRLHPGHLGPAALHDRRPARAWRLISPNRRPVSTEVVP